MRLPEEFRFDGGHVLIQRGAAVVLLPSDLTHQYVLDDLGPVSAGFMEHEREQPEDD